MKALNFLMKYPELAHFFVGLGESWVVTEELIDNVVEFECLYMAKAWIISTPHVIIYFVQNEERLIRENYRHVRYPSLLT